MSLFSDVYLREEKTNIRIVNGLDKPEIPETVRDKWQSLINQLSELSAVPASLIMRMTDSDMQVFLSSDSDGNPFTEGVCESLGVGLYCETVVGRNRMLEIQDASELPDWKDNPDMKLDMVSYLGFPLLWPDGAVFGTVCSLDTKKRDYAPILKGLMQTFKDIIELDLKREMELDGLIQDNLSLKHTIREINHRIKTHLYMITGLIQIRRVMGTGSVETLFQEIENRVRTIGLIHEKIYKSETLVPDTRSYISDLSYLLVNEMTNRYVDLQIDIENICFGKKLLDLGTAIVELITNSLKHGFGDTDDPRIMISLKQNDDSVIVRYADNGSGFDGEITEGLGMTVLRHFAGSLKGTLEIRGTDGFSAEIRFPPIDRTVLHHPRMGTAV